MLANVYYEQDISPLYEPVEAMSGSFSSRQLQPLCRTKYQHRSFVLEAIRLFNMHINTWEITHTALYVHIITVTCLLVYILAYILFLLYFFLFYFIVFYLLLRF